MFRFTICDVLWLAVVVALGAAWLVTLRNQQAARDKFINELLQRSTLWREEVQRDLEERFADSNAELPKASPEELSGSHGHGRDIPLEFLRAVIDFFVMPLQSYPAVGCNPLRN